MYINIPADMFGLQLIEYGTDFTDKQSCYKNVKRYLDVFLSAEPKVILLNVCYRRSFINSEVYDTVYYNIVRDENGEVVFDQNGNAKKQIIEDTFTKPNKYFKTFGDVFRTLLENDIDVFKMAIDYLHQNNVKVYFSVRLNDMHDHKDKYINNAFSLNYPEFCLKDIALYNFGHEKVQQLHIEYFKEMVKNYDIDGIELDYLRGAPYFLADENNRAEIFTDFMKKVKESVNAVNDKVKISIRAFLSKQIDDASGIDLTEWIANGTLNEVVLSNYYIPSSFEPDLKFWRELIDAKNQKGYEYKLICACDYGAGCTNKKVFTITPEILRGFKKSVCAYGADDIYLFNLAYDDAVKFGDKESGKTIEDLYKNLNNDGDSRFIHVSGTEFDGAGEMRYPINLQPNQEYKFQIRTDKAKSKGFMFVGTMENAQLSIRKDGKNEKAFSLVQKPENVVEYDEKTLWLKHITQASKVMYKSDELEIDEIQTYTIKNVGESQTNIDYIELLKQKNNINEREGERLCK